MKLKKSIKIQSTKIAKAKGHPVLKSNFSVDLEKYLKKKKFFFKKKSISSDQILIVLSSENINNQTLEYKRLLEKHIFIQKEKVSYTEYYIIISKEDFLNNEVTFSSLFEIFNFLLVAELKDKLTKDDLLKQLNKFSLYGVFSFKRWSDISNGQLFYDSRHEVGILYNTQLI